MLLIGLDFIEGDIMIIILNLGNWEKSICFLQQIIIKSNLNISKRRQMIQTYGQSYTSGLRYSLAKKKLENLFIKWLRANKSQAQQLLQKAKTGKLKPSCPEVKQKNPLFSHHKVPHQSLPVNSSDQSTIKVPKPECTISLQPLESGKKSLDQSMTKSLLKSNLFPKNQITIQPNSQRIPQFYFPQGKIDNGMENTIRVLNLRYLQNMINSVFGAKMDVESQGCRKLVKEVLGLPGYFSTCLLAKCANVKKITKLEFNKFWKQLQPLNLHKRAFLLLSSEKNKKYITVDDFKKFLKQILETHPGLQFLKQSPQFQDWYAICVINRIFFMSNKKNDYQLSYRQFKKSRILQSLFDIQSQPDINENKDFFSYQDFYVIYIKFWQLDSDHDFLLSKQQLSKYSGYTLSRKTIQRVFSQVARKFQHAQKMTFGDFSWFIYCVEDKTTEQSIQYWFKILDLDGNGVVAGYELEFFYEEQSQRLAYMDGNNTEFNFQNIVCQMMDLLKPKNSTQFQLEDFKKKKNQCGLFINFLTDLNKLVAFDQRDAYQQKNEKTEHPQWTQWDRFVKPEYKRVQNAGQYQDGQEMLNWQDDA